MEINLNYIKNEIEKLNALIDEYEENSLNLKNCFKSISFFWVGELEQKYMRSLEEKIKNIDLNIIDLETTKDIYNYIIEQYSNIGQKIQYNSSYRVKISNYFDEIINNYDSIIQKYNSINYSLDANLTTVIEQQRMSLMNDKNNLLNYVTSLKEMFNRLEELEKNISQKIYKLNLDLTVI